jgi:hypothetical protein
VKWIVPYTVVWHGQHIVEAETARDAVAEALEIAEWSSDGDDGVRYNAHEAFPVMS